MRWAKDEVDLWCEQWASQRRKMLGMTELQPKDRIGRLSSTLGAVREEGEGAAQGTVSQTFPECYTGDALLVNRAWKLMERSWREVIEAHYVFLFNHEGRPVKVRTKAQMLQIAMPTYWKHLTYGKNYIHSFVMVVTHLDQESRKVIETQNNALFA